MPSESRTEGLKRLWWEALEEQGGHVQGLEAIQGEGLRQVLSMDDDLRHVPGLGLVCLRVCEAPPGAWTIADTLLEQLSSLQEETGAAWWLVLLVPRVSGEGAQGYILGDLSSPPVKNPPQSGGGELLIKERRHLDSTRMILSIEKLATILMRNSKAQA